MITFRFPTNVSLEKVLTEYVIQREKLEGIKLMPLRSVPTQMVVWDELDNEWGMTAPHNMNTDPRVDTRPGSAEKKFTPLFFKGTDVLKESDLLMPRAYGSFGSVIDLSSEIGRIARARADKNYLRVEWSIWKTLTGRLQYSENGVKVDETFPVRTYDALVDWDLRDTATVLKDFNAIKLLSRGSGFTIAGATAYLNQTTCNWLIENNNEDDLKGFQNQNFVKLPYSVEEINKILSARALPMLHVYDEGYYDSAGNFQLFIPDGVVIVIGKRVNSETVGDWAMTPSLHDAATGQDKSGFFSIIEVNGQPNPGAVTIQALGAGKNPKVEITGGVYGGPRLFFPKSVIKMVVKH